MTARLNLTAHGSATLLVLPFDARLQRGQSAQKLKIIVGKFSLLFILANAEHTSKGAL